MSYWRYPPAEELDVQGRARVGLKCAECGKVADVFVLFTGVDPDLIQLAISAGGWSSTDHTVLCSKSCYECYYGKPCQHEGDQR